MVNFVDPDVRMQDSEAVLIDRDMRFFAFGLVSGLVTGKILRLVLRWSGTWGFGVKVCMGKGKIFRKSPSFCPISTVFLVKSITKCYFYDR